MLNISLTDSFLDSAKGLKPIFFNFQALPPDIGNVIQAHHPGSITVTRWTLLPTQVTIGEPLIQIFLLLDINKVQGPGIRIPICHPHGIDLGTRALILTSPHQGGNSGPDLLILICLHLEGVSLWERRQEFSGAVSQVTPVFHRCASPRDLKPEEDEVALQSIVNQFTGPLELFLLSEGRTAFKPAQMNLQIQVS